MSTQSPSGTTATIISMWSAMLGGAMGATVGLFGGGIAFSMLMGVTSGFVCSVIVVSLMLAATYVVSALVGAEFEDMPIGCSTTSRLSGALGAIGGGLGAVLLSQLGVSNLQTRENSIAVCWSITSVFPILLALLIVRLDRYRRTNPEGPVWLRPIVQWAEVMWDRNSHPPK